MLAWLGGDKSRGATAPNAIDFVESLISELQKSPVFEPSESLTYKDSAQNEVGKRFAFLLGWDPRLFDSRHHTGPSEQVAADGGGHACRAEQVGGLFGEVFVCLHETTSAGRQAF